MSIKLRQGENLIMFVVDSALQMLIGKFVAGGCPLHLLPHGNRYFGRVVNILKVPEGNGSNCRRVLIRVLCMNSQTFCQSDDTENIKPLNQWVSVDSPLESCVVVELDGEADMFSSNQSGWNGHIRRGAEGRIDDVQVRFYNTLDEAFRLEDIPIEICRLWEKARH